MVTAPPPVLEFNGGESSKPPVKLLQAISPRIIRLIIKESFKEGLAAFWNSGGVQSFIGHRSMVNDHSTRHIIVIISYF